MLFVDPWLLSVEGKLICLTSQSSADYEHDTFPPGLSDTFGCICPEWVWTESHPQVSSSVLASLEPEIIISPASWKWLGQLYWEHDRLGRGVECIRDVEEPAAVVFPWNLEFKRVGWVWCWSDLWLLKSNQFIIKSKRTFLPNLIKFPQCVHDTF